MLLYSLALCATPHFRLPQFRVEVSVMQGAQKFGRTDLGEARVGDVGEASIVVLESPIAARQGFGECGTELAPLVNFRRAREGEPGELAGTADAADVASAEAGLPVREGIDSDVGLADLKHTISLLLEGMLGTDCGAGAASGWPLVLPRKDCSRGLFPGAVASRRRLCVCSCGGPSSHGLSSLMRNSSCCFRRCPVAI